MMTFQKFRVLSAMGGTRFVASASAFGRFALVAAATGGTRSRASALGKRASRPFAAFGMSLAFAVFAVATSATLTASATAIPLPYYSPSFTKGSSACDSASVLTATPALAFPGMTLDDVQARVGGGYVFGAFQCGTQWPQKLMQSRTVLTCRDPETDAISKIVALFVVYDDGHTKTIAVELTDGKGGVYAHIGRIQYLRGTKNLDFAFAVADGAGGVTYSCDTDAADKAKCDIAIAGWNTTGYGVASLSIVKVAPAGAPALVWRNAPGEPVLTVEDIRDFAFTGRTCGINYANNLLGLTMTGYNTHAETNALGVATSLRVELQYKDGGYLKCALVEFTNGADGVYAQQTASIYKSGVNYGYKLVKDDGTYDITGSSTPGYYGYYGDTYSGYGVFELSAVPTNVPTALWNKAENMISKTHKVTDVTKLPVLTTTWVKLLDGVSLQEMFDDGYELSAYFCGGSVNTKQKVYAKGLQSYTPAGETSISNALCWFVVYDGGHTKSATVLLESRTDGVYAKYGRGQYLNKKNNLNFNFAWFDDDGNVVYECLQDGHTSTDSGQYPTTWTTAGYGIAGLKASRFMKLNDSRLVFANPAGEPVLTLDDIKDYYFGCSFAGNSISASDGEGVGLYRAFEYDANDSMSLMRMEFQVYDGNGGRSSYNKCLVVNFTNGVDGVYGYASSSRYAGQGSGKLGYHFVNADGTFAGTDGTVATNTTATGYGIYDLFAAPMVTLDHDTDWSVTDGVIPLGDAVIDLAGHSLTLPGVSGNGNLNYPHSQVFNSSNSVMAEVRFNVAGGLAFTNSTVYFGTSDAFLNNNVKFAKDGNGTCVAALGQASKGGTQLLGGTLAAGVAGTDKPFGATPQTFEIDSARTFDANGQTGFGNYSFVLNGGTIRSSAGSTAYDQGFFKNVSLTDDSAFVLSGNYGFIGDNYSAASVDLGGYTLSVEIGGGTLFLCNTTFGASGGVMDLVGDNYLQSGRSTSNANSSKTNDASTVDFRVNCRLNIVVPLNVHDYVALYGSNANLGTEAINVFGTFRPSSAHNYFHGCRMMDGSTIDLSARAAALPLVSAFTNENSDRTLKFADGATVYIALPEMKLPGGKVISWEEKPENIGTVRFRLAPGTAAKGAFIAKDDGLYLVTGLMIFVR